MNKILHIILILMALGIIAGCAGTDTMQSPVIQTGQLPRFDNINPVNRLGELMRFYDALLDKNTPQLTEEYDVLKNKLTDSSDAENRLKYILLVSIPGTAHTDINGALDLLNNWPQEALLSPNLANFRKFLIVQFTAQQKAGASTRNLLQQLRSAEEQVQTLQRRIDAIKNMEAAPLRRPSP